MHTMNEHKLPDGARQSMRGKARGMTLLELMIVVAGVAILAAIAVPNYRGYVLRAQRSDATAAILRVAAAQEKFYLRNNRYATDAEMALAPPNGLGIAGTERRYYTLSIVMPNGDPSREFVAVATADAGHGQIADTPCRTFSVDQSGARNAQTSASTVNTETCWR